MSPIKILIQNLKFLVISIWVKSLELSSLTNSSKIFQVPKLWADKSFLSEKPLSSWIEDLNARIDFLNNWIKFGTPKVYWISGKQQCLLRLYWQLSIIRILKFQSSFKERKQWESSHPHTLTPKKHLLIYHFLLIRFLLPSSFLDRYPPKLCQKARYCYR